MSTSLKTLFKKYNCVADIPKKDKIISTGSILIDKAIGLGGIPLGCMVEIFGDTGASKTTMALNVISNAQKKGLRCLFIDYEHKLNLDYAADLGVDLKKLEKVQPMSAEDGLNLHNDAIVNKLADVIVLDSVAALSCKAEVEGVAGESYMGIVARLMAQHCRKNHAICSKNEVLSLYLNQIRKRYGPVFGDPTYTPGGDSLKFYCTIRLELWASGKVELNGQKIGNKINCKVPKNTYCPPFKQAQTRLIFGKGYDNYSDMTEIFLNKDIITKSGGWYKYGDSKSWQGKDAIIKELKENKNLYNELTKKADENDKIK